MSGLLDNPTATGLIGGFAVIALQYLWKRVGNSEEKSIPTQLTEISVRLAEIMTILRLMQNDAEYSERAHLELKDDFWSHMRDHHGVGGGGGGTDPGLIHRPSYHKL